MAFRIWKSESPATSSDESERMTGVEGYVSLDDYRKEGEGFAKDEAVQMGLRFRERVKARMQKRKHDEKEGLSGEQASLGKTSG